MKEKFPESDILENITAYFEKYAPISKAAENYVKKHFYPVHARKSTHIIEPGQHNENLYFIFKGVVRGYIKSGNKEITTWINEENEIIGSIRNFALDKPSEEYLQALEDTDLIVLPMEAINYVYEKFPETNKVGRLIIEESYRDAEERAFICRLPSAEERYQRFLHHRGNLINRIPLKYIANYLNMNLETLSRIRSKKGK